MCRRIPELTAAEKELLAILRRREIAYKKVSAGEVLLIFLHDVAYQRCIGLTNKKVVLWHAVVIFRAYE